MVPNSFSPRPLQLNEQADLSEGWLKQHTKGNPAEGLFTAALGSEPGGWETNYELPFITRRPKSLNLKETQSPILGEIRPE